MDGNKDESLRCIRIAEAAIASRDKQRALKFIKIARRLNSEAPVNDLLTACENLDDSNSATDPKPNEPKPSSSSNCANTDKNYTQEHVKLILQVKRNKDYYSILGVDKTSSVEEIRKAYKKLSLKVHPDKNKAPGSEEAFKKVCKAFKCLSEEESRRSYDQTGGLVDEFEYNEQHNVRRRRRRTANDFFQDDFDPDEIFRSFFGQNDVFRNARVYRTRAAAAASTNQPREEGIPGGFNVMVLLQLLPILVIFLLAYLPFSEPEYALQKTYAYQYQMFTEKHGVEYFVKAADFEQRYPSGSSSRASFDGLVVRDYKNMLGRYCHVELQRRQWNRNYPTPHCDKLRGFGVA